MRSLRPIAAVSLCIALLGCATTKVEMSGTSMQAPLCQDGVHDLSAVVYWLPKWRPDQKEPPLREAAALRGIQGFFAAAGCISRVDIRRLPDGTFEEAPPDEELLHLATGVMPAPDRVFLIVVRELGPKLLIGIPVILEGGTEVVIEVRALNARTSESTANVRTHWQNGGKFVLRGVKSLDRDMSAALRATLMPAASSQ
jgi:hypothetical protein